MVPPLELCRVARLGAGVSCPDEGTGSIDAYLLDVLLEDRRTPPFVSASSILASATSEAGVGTFRISSGSSSKASTSSVLSDSTVAHEDVSCGFGRLNGRAMIRVEYLCV